MAYGTIAATADATKLLATDLIGSTIFPRTKVSFGAEGAAVDVSASTPLPVTFSSGVVLAAGNAAIGTVGVTGNVAVTGTFWQATQPVSLTSQPLPAGAATETGLTALGTKLDTINTSLNATGPLPAGTNPIGTVELGAASLAALETVAVTGPMTDAQARATPLPVLQSPGASLATGQVTATTTSAVAVAARAGRRNVTIVNGGTTPVFLGNSGVTASTGVLLPGVLGATITLETALAIHAVTGSGTAALSFFELF